MSKPELDEKHYYELIDKYAPIYKNYERIKDIKIITIHDFLLKNKETKAILEKFGFQGNTYIGTWSESIKYDLYKCLCEIEKIIN